MTWKSKAKWPDQAVKEGVDRITTDIHDTKEQAEAVCKMLERDGLGGLGKIFPVKTWVVNATPHPTTNQRENEI